MTELTFLLDLLLNHKLPLATKNLIKDRIGVIEAQMATTPKTIVQQPITQMQAPTPVVAVAQTPQAAEALARRAALIAQGDKPEAGRTGPRKF